MPALYTPGQIDGRSIDIVPCVASWTQHPNQAPTFRNQNQVWPVRVIRRGDAVRPLPPHARSLADLTFEVGGVRLSLNDYMARRRTAGLLILKHGEIALERYGMGNVDVLNSSTGHTACADGLRSCS